MMMLIHWIFPEIVINTNQPTSFSACINLESVSALAFFHDFMPPEWGKSLYLNYTACADFPTGVQLADENCITYSLTGVVECPLPRPQPFVDFFA